MESSAAARRKGQEEERGDGSLFEVVKNGKASLQVSQGVGCRGTDSEYSLHFNKRGGRGVGIEVQVWMLKSQRGTAFKFKGSLTVYQGL